MGKRKNYPTAPAGTFTTTANGRFRDKSTGRFLPTHNGRPLPPGWRKDVRGRPYNVEKRRAVALRNFGTQRQRGKKPKQGQNLGRTAGITLWKGPPAPRPRNQTIYVSISEHARIAASGGRKAAALTEWIELHGSPGRRFRNADGTTDAKDRGGLILGFFLLSTARWATDWSSGLLGYYPTADNGRGEWRYYATTQLSETPQQARDLGDEERDKYEAPEQRNKKGKLEKATDRLSIYFPIRDTRDPDDR